MRPGPGSKLLSGIVRYGNNSKEQLLLPSSGSQTENNKQQRQYLRQTQRDEGLGSAALATQRQTFHSRQIEGILGQADTVTNSRTHFGSKGAEMCARVT